MNLMAAKVTSPLTGEEGKPGREHDALSLCIEDVSTVLDKLRSASTRVLRSGMVSGLELMIDALPKAVLRASSEEDRASWDAVLRSPCPQARSADEIAHFEEAELAAAMEMMGGGTTAGATTATIDDSLGLDDDDEDEFGDVEL